MTIEIKVPNLPESVADGLLLDWHKQAGEQVSRDEILVEVETDKVVLEVRALDDGVLSEIKAEAGETVTSEQVLGVMEAGEVADDNEGGEQEKAQDKKTVAQEPESDAEQSDDTSSSDSDTDSDAEPLMGPAVQRLVEEHELDPASIPATGPGGRLTKEDLLKFIDGEVSPDNEDDRAPAEKKVSRAAAPKDVPMAEKASAKSTPATQPESGAKQVKKPAQGSREERREPMSRLRQTIANRLVQSQQTAAILTTFNEVDMSTVMDMRVQYKEKFEKTHGARLGFMSFFVKASVAALEKFPLVNAYIDGSDIVQHDYQDIGIAVSSPRGLVVPVLRNCADMNFAQIESQINEFGGQASAGKIDLSDLMGGTFTITNGGVFGSLLSTPIINPPQSAILGMHSIQQRPVAEDGAVVIRPMMYLALSYDHRIVDGKEAVQFLVTIKEMIEDPARLLLDC